MKDLVIDDEEFTSCHYCKSSLQVYNNTSSASLSISPEHTDEYTQTLLSYGHLNCEKCGLYIPIHPENHAEESLIFVCSNKPHRHCLCFQCGLLYNLKTERQSSSSILTQMQYTSASDAVSAEIEAKPSTNNNNVLPSNDCSFTNVDIVNGTTFVAQIVQQMATPNGEDHDGTVQPESSMDDNDGSALFIGTIMALMVWLGIYLNSPELRFIIWCAVVYFLTSVYFTDDSMQNAVYSLFSFSPIFAAIYIFEKTRNVKEGEIERDVQRAIQFFCVVGCIAYLRVYWGPVQMFEFLANDFMKLGMMHQVISIFIAASIASFILILTKNCLCLQRMVLTADKAIKSVDDVVLPPKDIICDGDDDVAVCDLSIGLETEISKSVESNENEVKRKKRRRRRRAKKKKIMD